MRNILWGLALSAAMVLAAGLPGESAAKPSKAPASTCTGDYGTNVEFADTPKAAAEQAKKEQKLVLVLHISGHFEDPKLT
jgi:hypothetical protein